MNLTNISPKCRHIKVNKLGRENKEIRSPSNKNKIDALITTVRDIYGHEILKRLEHTAANSANTLSSC